MKGTENNYRGFVRNLYSIKSEQQKTKEIIKQIEMEQKNEEKMMKQTNREFAFEQLELINLHKLPIDVINILTNPHKCKELFNIYKSILTVEIVERERYYTTKSFRYWKDGKTYYVTNDWYTKNRKPFSRWLKKWCKNIEKERLLSFSKN